MTSPGMFNPNDFDSKEEFIAAVNAAGKKQGWRAIIQPVVDLIKHGEQRARDILKNRRSEIL